LINRWQLLVHFLPVRRGLEIWSSGSFIVRCSDRSSFPSPPWEHVRACTQGRRARCPMTASRLVSPAAPCALALFAKLSGVEICWSGDGRTTRHRIFNVWSVSVGRDSWWMSGKLRLRHVCHKLRRTVSLIVVVRVSCAS